MTTVVLIIIGFSAGVLLMSVWMFLDAARQEHQRKFAAALDCALRVPPQDRAHVISTMLEAGLIEIEQAIEIVSQPDVDRRQKR